MVIGFASSPRFVQHDTGTFHPERPDRVRAILTAVRQAGLISSPNPLEPLDFDFGFAGRYSHLGAQVRQIEPTLADESWLLTVHSQRHIEYVKRVCQAAPGVLDQGDTPVCPKSFEIALLSLGSLLCSCDAVMKKEVRRAFSAARPPGHHAERERSMGFCIFSNLAIAAKYLQQRWDLRRIAIVDFDLHHGNGTQSVFELDPSVFFVSLHQHPHSLWPGTGYQWEIGRANGRGYTLNIPFEPGAGDEEFMKVIDGQVAPELYDFAPEFILISAGFDAHRDDPLGQLELTEQGYELMTRSICAVADHHCDGRVVSALEGGYNLAALGRSAVRHMVGMM